MVAGRKQHIRVMTGWIALLWLGTAIAQEEIAPRVPAVDAVKVDPVTRVNPPKSEVAPSPAELKEIEWIKSQLGSGYSIATRLERLTVAEETPQEADLPKIVGPDVDLWEGTPRIGTTSRETRMLRVMARQLELSAAQLEERGDFVLADQMRQLALSHWRLARVAGIGQLGNSDEAKR